MKKEAQRLAKMLRRVIASACPTCTLYVRDGQYCGYRFRLFPRWFIGDEEVLSSRIVIIGIDWAAA
jgi:hypothetical protein